MHSSTEFEFHSKSSGPVLFLPCTWVKTQDRSPTVGGNYIVGNYSDDLILFIRTELICLFISNDIFWFNLKTPLFYPENAVKAPEYWLENFPAHPKYKPSVPKYKPSVKLKPCSYDEKNNEKNELQKNFYKKYKFIYKNYKGCIEVRSVIPESIRFGSTQWHPVDQWLLKAWDLDKKDYREFALKDITLIPNPELLK